MNQEIIGYGTFSVVQETNDSSVVVKRPLKMTIADSKEISLLERISTFLSEINVYSSLEHENICKFVKHDGFDLYLERCIPIERALMFLRITEEEVVNQLLGVLHFLRKAKIFHNDIKPPNILFIEGKLKLIDFGLSEPTIDIDQIEFVVHPLFSFVFPKEEFNNSVEMEMFIVGLTLDRLFPKCSERTQKIIDECCVRRADLNHVIEKFKIPLTPGTIRSESGTYPVYSQQVLKDVFIKMLKICYEFNLPIYVFFFAIHTYRRLSSAYPEHIIIFICSSIYGLSIKIPEDPSNIVLEIVDQLEGRIKTTTYWDLARSTDDLVNAYNLSLSPVYPFPHLLHSQLEDVKLVSCRAFLKMVEKIVS